MKTEDLHKYFENAKNSFNPKPILDEEITREILSSSDLGKSKSNYKYINKLKGKYKMFALTSAIGLILAGYMLFNPGNNEEINKNSQNKIVLNDIAKSSTNIEKSDNPLTYNKKENSSAQKIEFSIGHDLTIEIPLIVLQNNELEKLNLIRNKNGFIINFEDMYDFMDNGYYSEELIPKNYPEKGIYRSKYFLNDGNLTNREIIKYSGWKMNKSDGTYPIAIKSFRINKTGGTNSTSKMGSSPLINPKINGIISMERQLFDTMLINFDKAKPGVLNSNSYLKISKAKYNILQNLVPVLLKWEDEKSINYAIVWYVPTKKFLENLPDNYRSFVEKSIKSIEYLDCDGCEENPNNKTENKQVIEAKKIAGIEQIILSPEELSKINIFWDGAKFTTYFQAGFNIEDVKSKSPEIIPMVMEKLKGMGYSDSFSKGIIRTKQEIDKNGVNGTETKYTGWDLTKPSPALPLALTMNAMNFKYNKFKKEYEGNNTGVTSISDSPFLPEMKDKNVFDYDKNSNLIPLVDRLIPVHVEYGIKNDPDSSKIDYMELNFWFYVNEEFAELLPDKYRIPLLNELKILSDVEKGDIELKNACNALKGEKSLLGLCKMSSDNINGLSIFPNPSNNPNLTIQFILKNKCDYSIDLYDYSGNLIENIISNKNSNPGEQSINVKLDENIGDGLYLISITDNLKNHISQKLIIKR